MADQDTNIRLIIFENTAIALREASKQYLLVRGKSVLRSSIDHYGEVLAPEEGRKQIHNTKKYPLY